MSPARSGSSRPVHIPHRGPSRRLFPHTTDSKSASENSPWPRPVGCRLRARSRGRDASHRRCVEPERRSHEAEDGRSLRVAAGRGVCFVRTSRNIVLLICLVVLPRIQPLPAATRLTRCSGTPSKRGRDRAGRLRGRTGGGTAHSAHGRRAISTPRLAGNRRAPGIAAAR